MQNEAKIDANALLGKWIKATQERDHLRMALERTLDALKLGFAGKPIRDADEIIAEAERALCIKFINP